MSGWLIMVVAVIYAIAVVLAFYDGDWRLGIMLLGWTIGNIGAGMLAWR